jgi:hypothetical protein
MIYGTKLKELLRQNGYSLTRINNKLNTLNGTNKTIQNLSNKINHESLKYTEVLQILSIINYSCEWIPSYEKIRRDSKYNCEIGEDMCYFSFTKRGK